MSGAIARASLVLSLVVVGAATTSPIRGTAETRAIQYATLANARGAKIVVRPAGALPPVDSAIWKTLRWRSLGPDRGGRSLTVAGVRGQPKVGYFGATGGGLW